MIRHFFILSKNLQWKRGGSEKIPAKILQNSYFESSSRDKQQEIKN
jgi:hypothetical protein